MDIGRLYIIAGGCIMLKTFIQLLGDDAPVFRRYASMAIAYGVLCGLTITVLVPVLSHLLAGEVQAASLWLAVLLAGMVVCWAWRRMLEKAGAWASRCCNQGASA